MGESGLGRRVIGEEKKRKHRLSVRMTESERALLVLEAKKKGITQSDMLRHIIRDDIYMTEDYVAKA